MRTEEQKAKKREYVKNNKEKVREWNRVYYQRHKEEIDAKRKAAQYSSKYLKKYRASERVKQIRVKQSRAYKNRHKDIVSKHNHERLQRIKNAQGSHNLKEFAELKRLAEYTCPMCGKKEPEIKLVRDHIIPLINGGTDSIDNIQPLCNKCNCKKYTQTIKFQYQKQKG